MTPEAKATLSSKLRRVDEISGQLLREIKVHGEDAVVSGRLNPVDFVIGNNTRIGTITQADSLKYKLAYELAMIAQRKRNEPTGLNR